MAELACEEISRTQSITHPAYLMPREPKRLHIGIVIMPIIDSLRWFSQRRSQRLILGVSTQGAMTPKFKLGGDFCTLHLPRKFHHPMFTRSEVIVLRNIQTNKQTDAAETPNTLRYAMTLGN